MINKICGILILLCLLAIQGNTQPIDDKHVLRQEDFEQKEDSLKQIWWSNKSCSTADFELHCLAALSFYPELKEPRIKFRERRIKETMRVRPNIGFFFRKRKNRRYVLTLNKNRDPEKGIVLSDMSFNALTGIIGHELGHILDFTQKGSFRILGNGIAYVFSRNFRKKYETETDVVTIRHDLRFQLYEARTYLINESNAPDKVKEELQTLYMTPAEILWYPYVR